MLDILNILYVVAVVLLLFGAAIFVHEFGHFWVALKRGLVVEEFAIGFGPIIWSKEKDGILYTIRCIPAGGFVKLPQMLTSEAIEGKADDKERDGEDEGEKEDNNEPLPEPLPQVSPLSKILVAFAGPIMNVIFAILIAVFLWIVGLPQQVNDPVVGYVGKSSEEYALGVRPGDVFQSINGDKVESWQDIIYGVLDSTGPTVKTVLLQGDREVPVNLPANTWNGGIRRIRLDNQDRLEIQTVREPSLLASAGFRADDLVLKVNGNRAYSQYHLIDLLMENVGEEKVITVQRNGNVKQLNFSTPKQTGVMVGAVPRPEHGTWAKLLSKLGKDLKPLEATPAMKADVQENDLIQAINGQRITSTRHLVDIIHANGDKKMELELIRGDETLTVSATPKDNQLGIALMQDIGIIFKPEAIKYVEQRPGPTPWAQVEDVLDKVAITFRALGRGKESGVGAKDLSGPIGIFGMLSIQVNTDLRLALSFLVLLNINLAILNLLPVPVLDGGHILLSLIEWVRKKPVSVRLQEYATTVFAVLLLCFFLFITLADVKRVPLLHDIFNRDTQIEQSSEPAQ
jgi:regulator of sigma E protease